MNLKNLKFVLHGILAALALSALYFFIVSFVQSFEHAVDEFLAMWYLLLPLVVGFGVQMGLFSYIHSSIKTLKTTSSVAASAGISTASMVACCAHHLTEILPVLGFSVATLFLTKYQPLFILFGVLSNFFGIIMLLTVIKTNELYDKNGMLAFVFAFDLVKTRNAVIVLSAVVLFVVFFVTTFPLTNPL